MVNLLTTIWLGVSPSKFEDWGSCRGWVTRSFFGGSFFFVLWVSVSFAQNGETSNTTLTKFSEREISALITKLYEVIEAENKKTGNSDSISVVETHSATITEYSKQVHRHGDLAIPFVFKLYNQNVGDVTKLAIRRVIVFHILGTWPKGVESGLFVNGIKDIVLHDPDVEIRSFVAQQIVSWHPNLFLEEIEKMLEDSSYQVRNSAVVALKYLGVLAVKSSDVPKVTGLFERVLTRKNLLARFGAALGILLSKNFVENKKKEAIDAVMEMLDAKADEPRTVILFLLQPATRQHFGNYPIEANYPEREKILSLWKNWWVKNKMRASWDEKRGKFIIPNENE